MSAARHAYGQPLYREPWDVPRMTTPSHSSARDQTLSAKYQLCIRLLLLQAPIIPTRCRGRVRRPARWQGDTRSCTLCRQLQSGQQHGAQGSTIRSTINQEILRSQIASTPQHLGMTGIVRSRIGVSPALCKPRLPAQPTPVWHPHGRGPMEHGTRFPPPHNISFISGKYQVCALARHYSVPHHPARRSVSAVPGRRCGLRVGGVL
jgi:hypothetical protein